YKHEEGALLNNYMNRATVGLNLNPTFFKENLKVEVNTKYTINNNSFSDQGAIGAAISFDPTQPAYSGNEAYGGYFEWLDQNGKPNTLAMKNPLGLVNQKQDLSDVHRFIGNAKLDYRLPFLPALHAVVNVGGDFTHSAGTVVIPATAASQFLQGGQKTQYEQTKGNRLLETYLNYDKRFEKIKSELDFTGGYSYQNWSRQSPSFPVLKENGDTITRPGIDFYTENTLISYYGRLNFTVNKKYVLTATLRRDGSSRFSPDTRWGMFPSAAFAWKISDENFMKNNRKFTYLKLRAGYGVTGQQDIGNDYPYQPNYQKSTSTAQYQFGYDMNGNPMFYGLLRPDGYDYNIKWEQTASSNIGFDYGFFNDRIYGSIDFYLKQTKDLLAVVNVPAGANFKNQILTNVGSMTNRGVEFELNVVAISKKETELIIGANATSNYNEITKLTQNPNANSKGILTGGIDGGIGNNIQIQSVGHAANSFYVYEQKYDDQGKPIAGEFVDRNNDGVINTDDRYIYKKPTPAAYIGIYLNLTHKKWTFATNVRSELGRYVYNNVNSTRGYYGAIPAQNYIVNLNPSFLESGLMKSTTNQFLSDYWIEKANFIRMDYFRVGYDMSDVFKDKIHLQVGVTVNNVFVISPYSGIDPEIANGIDLNLYPRPRIFALNLNFNF
ncbi:SusC/RagA family TonB-linked outer membrane protein, partial [bacterium]|nr:SusC/RagA family TonB-linked outer membrane protein [bacterium]